jgi:hypothetical protein
VKDAQKKKLRKRWTELYQDRETVSNQDFKILESMRSEAAKEV